jgi:hypothetical protein
MKAWLHIGSPLLGRLNAAAVLVAWACLASFVVLLGYIKFASVPDRRAVVALVVVLAAFVACLVVHAVLTFWVRCPRCSKHLTGQGFSKPRYGDWSTAVVTWFSGAVTCIHCGSRVSTRWKR